MESYRIEARQRLRSLQEGRHDGPVVEVTELETETNPSWKGLWNDIQSRESRSTADTCESFIAAEIFLQDHGPCPFPEDEEAVSSIFSWAATAVLPTKEFASSWESAQITPKSCEFCQLEGYFGDTRSSVWLIARGTDEPRNAKEKLERSKSSFGTSLLHKLDSLFPIEKLGRAARFKVVIALVVFTRRNDPWTTDECFSRALELLKRVMFAIYREKESSSLATALLEDLLKSIVRPAFAKTKNIAITPAGRKNEHPVATPRFDPSLFDDGSKPWKFKEVYVPTVLAWIVEQYRTSDAPTIEAHFPLLVPPILSLIDDDGLAYKALGCDILSRLLIPISEAKSDILSRTNLDSVFQDALSPCLLSLPTLTPENESIHLLKSAYPAIFSVIRTRFPSSPSAVLTSTASGPSKTESNSPARLEALTRILRHNILPSYHHTSSPRPIHASDPAAVQDATTAATTISLASYPYPALSTLFFEQLACLLPQLGTHATPYLQEIIPPLVETLTNPFGTAYLPLLTSAAAATRDLTAATWMRVWRWRGEVLRAVCLCWVHLEEDERDVVREHQRDGEKAVAELRGLLKVVVEMLRIATEEVVGGVNEGESEILLRTEAQREAGEAIDIMAEFKELVDTDLRLKPLLLPGEGS